MSPSAIWRKLFDVRKGEAARTLFMSLYLLCVMVAYYILKPVSAAMFLNKFNIDKLPYLGTGKLDLRQVKEIAPRA